LVGEGDADVLATSSLGAGTGGEGAKDIDLVICVLFETSVEFVVALLEDEGSTKELAEDLALFATTFSAIQPFVRVQPTSCMRKSSRARSGSCRGEQIG